VQGDPVRQPQVPITLCLGLRRPDPHHQARRRLIEQTCVSDLDHISEPPLPKARSVTLVRPVAYLVAAYHVLANRVSPVTKSGLLKRT
jgi:hypothetical protein